VALVTAVGVAVGSGAVLLADGAVGVSAGVGVKEGVGRGVEVATRVTGEARGKVGVNGRLDTGEEAGSVEGVHPAPKPAVISRMQPNIRTDCLPTKTTLE